jgi:23S rRNA pseudouridine1911/1915/1917 synthase
MGQPLPPPILEDNHLLAFCKPAGLATAPPAEPGEVTLSEMAQGYLKKVYQKAGNVYLGVVHRLDRPTSGVVLFARTSKAAARLSEQFQDKTTRKVYLACFVAKGQSLADSGDMVDWMRAEGAAEGRGVRHAERAQPGTQGAKEARLSYQVVARGDGLGLAVVRPSTGRTHQIRAQFAWRGCPLVGDERYGAPRGVRGGTGIGLHAWGLGFRHPTREEWVSIVAKPDSIWPDRLGAGAWLGRALSHLDDPWRET